MITQGFLKITYKTTLYFFFVFFLSFSSQNQLFAQDKPFTVVLDAGHGGKDTGNLGTKRYKDRLEKDIALEAVLKVGRLVEQKLPDVKVIYTRKTDVFIPLHQRANIANKADADLFISVHCNAATEKAHGTETFVLGVSDNKRNLEMAKRENDVILLEKDHEKHYEYDANSPESLIGLTLMQEKYLDKSIEFAKMVEDNFVSIGDRRSRGVKQAVLQVIYQTYMPSVLVEIGFLTNKNEEDFLRSNNGQDKVTQSIYRAIKQYKANIDKNAVKVIDTPKPAVEQKDSNETVKTSEDKKTSKTTFDDVVFKVQIASGKRKIKTKSYNFKGLKGVERVKVQSAYKYYYGNDNDYEKVKNSLKTAKKKGYKTAFIVAFKNGEKVSVTKVLKNQ